MKLWIDDVREAPKGYTWVKTVDEARELIDQELVLGYLDIDLIDIDHDAGEYAEFGGDYIKLLDWMEEVGYKPNAIHVHTMNPVGVQNMRAIIQKNGWNEI